MTNPTERTAIDENGPFDERMTNAVPVAKTIRMTTYPTLRSANIARQMEWDGDNQISASYRGNELAGEVGEACNVIKKLERERMGMPGSRATVDELANELADVLICADLIAAHYGVDLEAAVQRKFNATSEKVGLSTRLSVPTNASEAWRLEYVAAEAYQVIGALATHAGLFEHPEVTRALDYFSNDKLDGSLLPWAIPVEDLKP